MYLAIRKVVNEKGDRDTVGTEVQHTHLRPITTIIITSTHT